MSEQRNLDLVRTAYANFQKGDISAIIAVMDEDVEWKLPGSTEDIAILGTRHGRDGVADFFATLASTEEVLQFEPREFLAQGDRVVVLGHYSWRVIATGRVAESDWAHVFTVRDGKVKAFQEYSDTASLVEAYRPASTART